VSGPEGSSTKEYILGAAGSPGLSTLATTFLSFITPLVIMSELDDTTPTYPIPKPKQDNLRRFWLIVIVVLLVTLPLTAGLLIHEFQKSDPIIEQPILVTLLIDGVTYPVSTMADTVADLLQEQAIVLQENDLLRTDVNAPLTDGMIVQIDRARPVNITVDDETTVILTTHENPYDVLRLAGVSLNPDDRIYVDGLEIAPGDLLAYPLPVSEIVIWRAIPVQILDGDVMLQINAIGETVGDALYEAGITIYLADRVTPEVSARLTPNMQIVIERAKPISIVVDGERTETRVSAETVGAAIAEAQIPLTGLDYTIPSEDTAILPGMLIQVIRVTEEIITEQDIIPFETVYQADASMNLDTRAVLQAGQNGIIERSIRVRYENGVEISREPAGEQVVQERRDQIIAYGTNVVIRTLQTPDGTIEYWRHLRMYATSYYPAELGGDNITAIGETLHKGIVGINPRIIPYRTMMYVPGYGVGMAADTGGPRTFSYWVDLGYSDEDWVSWSRWVDVYLLTPVPETINYLLPQEERGGPVSP